MNSVVQLLSECLTEQNVLHEPNSDIKAALRCFVKATNQEVDMKELQGAKTQIDVIFPEYSGGFQEDAYQLCLSIINTLDHNSPVRENFLILGKSRQTCNCGQRSDRSLEELGLCLTISGSLQNSII